MEVRSRQPRHLHVGDQALDAAPAIEIQESLGAIEGDGVITKRFEETFYGLAHRLVVVDDRNERSALQRRFLAAVRTAASLAPSPKVHIVSQEPIQHRCKQALRLYPGIAPPRPFREQAAGQCNGHGPVPRSAAWIGGSSCRLRRRRYARPGMRSAATAGEAISTVGDEAMKV